MHKLLIIVCLAAAFGLQSCVSAHEEKHEEVAHFQVTSPVKMDTVITNEYVCRIHSINNIEIRALEKGYLEAIYVDEGDFIKKGTKMFQIMPMLYQAELKKAEAEAEFAKIEYLNTKALADSNIVSANELALAKAKYDKANAELALAQVHLGFTEIKAPFDGIMDRLQVRRGSLVDEGDLLTTLSDNQEMWVYFNVPEVEYLDYMSHAKKGDMTKVELKMANNRMFEFSGKVETIEAEFNPETGNIPFRATFPNPKGLLRNGETGNIMMPVPLKDAIIIPQKATYDILDKKYVYVVDENQVIHSKQIVIDEELPHLYVVKEGLDEDDVILLEGLRKVRDNEQIEIRFEEPKEVLAHLKLHAE